MRERRALASACVSITAAHLEVLCTRLTNAERRGSGYRALESLQRATEAEYTCTEDAALALALGWRTPLMASK